MARKKLKRKVNRDKKLLGRYLLLVEGKTEKKYFEFLRSKLDKKIADDIIIKVISMDGNGNLNKKLKLVEQKRKELSIEEEDTFVVMDGDDKNVDLQKVKDKKYKLILSNPCFEVWFLLHYQDKVNFDKCNEVENKLKYHWENYKKGNIFGFDEAFTGLKEAVANSKSLKNSQYFSDVYIVIEKIFGSLINEASKIKGAVRK